MTDNSKTQNEKRNPYAQMYQGLRSVKRELESLQISLNTVLRQARILDRVPYPHFDLDEETWQTVSEHPNALYHPLIRSIRDLNCALESIDQSAGHIHGLFQDEQKAQTEDRIAAFASEGDKLLKAFRQLLREHQMARNPSVIRQQALSILLLTFSDIQEPLAALRQSVSRDQLAEGMFDTLIAKEAVLNQLKVEITALHDNPAQNMGDQLQSCLDRITSAHAAFERLIDEAREGCIRAGIQFYNRAGRVF